MDSQRNLLFIALLFVSFLIWQQWEGDKVSQNTTTTTQVSQQADMPSSDSLAVTGNSNEQAKLITVKLTYLIFRINTQGGTIDEADLLAYPAELNSKPLSVYWKLHLNSCIRLKVA